jgi:hypothetical protein
MPLSGVGIVQHGGSGTGLVIAGRTNQLLLWVGAIGGARR